eukprot:TRINITY_DN302_c0_g1_i1.p1 TRINITY_DN302_c0_g1~~TRINITY_DN302_c0_g1_i1.p1  ORF type:complete len:309 (-),score=141.09 TRINITY_DN302_c0_g1_i1:188-1093(-)
MILLEYNNRIIFETFRRAISSEKRAALDVTLADFDGVQFHISTPNPDARNVILYSIQWPAVEELLRHGAQKDLEKIYGGLVTDPESGYQVSLQIDLDNLPAEPEKLPLKLSFLKRHLLAAPFMKIFGAIHNKQNPTEVVVIPYRTQTDEAFFIKPEGDRCIVVFSVRFSDKNDRVLAKVFLQEFADARKSMRNVPAVQYTTGEVPGELAGVAGVPDDDEVGFVSFVLFEQSLLPKNAFKTINLLQSFRNYLHYHIKCSKAYMHERMRDRVHTWLQVLNRARIEPFEKKEKKLASGRSFKRR